MVSIEVILASASPRRQELLNQIGVPYQVQVADIEEVLPAGKPLGAAVEEVALNKAQAVIRSSTRGLVLGADTVVVLENQILGKPSGPEEARFMLSCLQGKEHRVITGVALVNATTGAVCTGREETRVWMRPLDGREINSYVATGEPLDKAGAYGIQGKGALLVDKIEGCYFNVVGLPLKKVAALLAGFGLDVWAFKE